MVESSRVRVWVYLLPGQGTFKGRGGDQEFAARAAGLWSAVSWGWGRVWRPRNSTAESGLGGMLEGRLVHAGWKVRFWGTRTGGLGWGESGAQGLGKEISPGVQHGGGWTTLTNLSPHARLLPVAHAGCRHIMSRMGALGGACSGLGLLLGTAAGLGFLCALYSQRWKRTQRHGQSQLLPNSLDYTQTSEPGRQGRNRSTEAAGMADGWIWGPGCLACWTGQRRGMPENFHLLESLLKRKAVSFCTHSPTIPREYIVKRLFSFHF